MTTQADAIKLAEDGKSAFQAGRCESAVGCFRSAEQSYAKLGDHLNQAEQRNNLSVALLKAGRPREALGAATGTDEVFGDAGDIRRQGIAVNNQAAALESLGSLDEALAAYERSAQLLGEAGERELRSQALKAAAAMQLRRGKIGESGLRMMEVLEARDRPSIFERVLRFLLRVMPR